MTARRPLLAGSQADRILGWLSAGRTLTPLQALARFNCLTCSQRVTQLKQRGHQIETRMVRVGKKLVAQYRLVS